MQIYRLAFTQALSKGAVNVFFVESSLYSYEASAQILALSASRYGFLTVMPGSLIYFTEDIIIHYTAYNFLLNDDRGS